ncbi:hypothetical protein WS71_05820 [Burkholderia mayonis]|uniref:Uncharacterized protein n=1 Tax=Burkholderia mayonis TaxID=1385591 RepID=A0A1B4FTB8_9BURK|nr:hypothetical protein WS71_05820 [Burkholderia mayonis]KVE57593.1 hypothetical protein WS71_26005 [Burkholderia mayonis]
MVPARTASGARRSKPTNPPRARLRVGALGAAWAHERRRRIDVGIRVRICIRIRIRIRIASHHVAIERSSGKFSSNECAGN